MQIPLSNPDITELEIKYVTEVLRTPHLSLGPKLAEFEQKMAYFVGRKYAIAVNSGTAGLHLVIRALGIGEGDEVITTPFSFIASANCLLFERAKPVFVDIEPLTFNIDVNLIERQITPKTKAILAVDVFGHPAEWERLEEIGRRYNLKLIDDSCEALGAEYKGRRAGTFGNVAVFSFYPNKQITTGEGGIILTDDEETARLCQNMRNQGRKEGSNWLEHQRLGYNYRLSDINCALGIAQLERITEILAKRERVARWYSEQLKELEEVRLPYSLPWVKRSWFVYVPLLSERYSKEDRDRILNGLSQRGIGCRDYFPPIHLQRFYKEMFGYEEGDFPVTEYVASRTMALPFYTNLERDKVEQVVDDLRWLLRDMRPLEPPILVKLR